MPPRGVGAARLNGNTCRMPPLHPVGGSGAHPKEPARDRRALRQLAASWCRDVTARARHLLRRRRAEPGSGCDRRRRAGPVHRPAHPARTVSERIGVATNNVSRIPPLVAAFQAAREFSARRIRVRADSQLLIRQLEGRYRVKQAHLRPYFERARSCSPSTRTSTWRTCPASRTPRPTRWSTPPSTSPERMLLWYAGLSVLLVYFVFQSAGSTTASSSPARCSRSPSTCRSRSGAADARCSAASRLVAVMLLTIGRPRLLRRRLLCLPIGAFCRWCSPAWRTPTCSGGRSRAPRPTARSLPAPGSWCSKSWQVWLAACGSSTGSASPTGDAATTSHGRAGCAPLRRRRARGTARPRRTGPGSSSAGATLRSLDKGLAQAERLAARSPVSTCACSPAHSAVRAIRPLHRGGVWPLGGGRRPLDRDRLRRVGRASVHRPRSGRRRSLAPGQRLRAARRRGRKWVAGRAAPFCDEPAG